MTASRRRLIATVKTLLALAILAAVGRHFVLILSSDELSFRDLPLRWGELLLAGLLYLTAHTLWGTFFFQLLRYEGATVSWSVGLRTYFISQFGKYVPGKAWVILIRVALLRKHGVSATVVAICGTYETLTTMAAGAMLGVCLFPWLGLSEIPHRDGGPLLRFGLGSWEWVILATLAGLPLVLAMFNRRLMQRLSARRGPDAVPLPCPSLALLLRGLLQACLGWCLLGVSLWLTLRSVLPTDLALTGELFAESLAAVCVAYVAGFAAFLLPGGVGVREVILQRVLSKQMTGLVLATAAAPRAVVAAVLLRLVWTLFEVLAASFLSLAWKPRIVTPRPGPAPAGLPRADEVVT